MEKFEPNFLETPLPVIVTRLDYHMRTLKQKDIDVEGARKKVTQDVEKLISNQNDFDLKVTEISDLYKKLQDERRKLKKYRQNLYSDLPNAKE